MCGFFAASTDIKVFRALALHFRCLSVEIIRIYVTVFLCGIALPWISLCYYVLGARVDNI